MINMENYNIINTYATIFAAIGTTSAVIVSLYFAYSSRKISLKVSANIFIGTEDCKEYILIRIINDGYRNVKISQFIAWQFGMFKKTNVMVGEKYISNQSDTLPAVLYEGEEKVIIIGIEQENGENYFENLFNDFMKKNPMTNINTLKLLIHPNIGKPITINIDKSIKDAINDFNI